MSDLELELQALTGGRRAKTIDGVHDLLRRLGDLRADEIEARSEGLAAADALAALDRSRRALRIRVGGEERWIAIEDLARYRDALGVSPPAGVAETWLGPTELPLDGLLLRWARTHAPFTAAGPAGRWGIAASSALERLRALAAAGSLLEGEFRPGGVEREFTDPDVLRALRRRSLARLRREVEPMPPEALARFLPAWQGIGSQAGGPDRLLEAIVQLEGVPIPTSILERDVLRARVRDYGPRLLDELGAAGRWSGSGAGRWGATTGESRSIAATGSTCWPAWAMPTGRRDRCMPGYGSTSIGAGRASSASCALPYPMLEATMSCSTRSGISSGPAK